MLNELIFTLMFLLWKYQFEQLGNYNVMDLFLSCVALLLFSNYLFYPPTDCKSQDARNLEFFLLNYVFIRRS